MPISTACGDCRKKYTVKSEMAGKRFRCKDCEAIVTVPETVMEEEDDPFAGEELKSTGRPIRQYEDDDEDDEDETSGREHRIRREPKAKPVKKKRAKGPAIPVSAVFAIVLQSLLTALQAYGFLGTLTEGGGNAGGLIGIFFRFTIALVVLVGLLQRKENARHWSRGLCIFGDVAGGLILLVMLLLAPGTEDTMTMTAALVVQCVIWTAMIFCLSTESAEDWFNK